MSGKQLNEPLLCSPTGYDHKVVFDARIIVIVRYFLVIMHVLKVFRLR